MDKSFKKRLEDLERILKKHEPAICICRKIDGGKVEISVDGEKLYFNSMNDANVHMDKYRDTVFVILDRISTMELNGGIK